MSGEIQMLVRHNRETRRCYVPPIYSDASELTQDHLHYYFHTADGNAPEPRGDQEYELVELLIPDAEDEESCL